MGRKEIGAKDYYVILVYPASGIVDSRIKICEIYWFTAIFMVLNKSTAFRNT